MITLFQLAEILEGKPKQKDLVTEQKGTKWIAYFRSKRSCVAFGETELESLDNLQKTLKY